MSLSKVEYDLVRAKSHGYQALNVTGRGRDLVGLTEDQYKVIARSEAAKKRNEAGPAASTRPLNGI